jgi:hypothetical protein
VQFVHRTEPKASSLCFPAAHPLHCDCPVEAANLPPLHCAHSVALAPLNAPAGHSSHDDAPVAFWCLPAVHGSQNVIAVPACCLPISHALQCSSEVPLIDELPKRPASHSLQAAVCSVLHFPPGHVPLQELLVDP